MNSVNTFTASDGWPIQFHDSLSASRVAPLREILEEAYRNAVSRKKKAISKIRLTNLGWDTTLADSFRVIQEQLANAVKQARRNLSLALCVRTDANDNHWAAALTQCKHAELKKLVTEQAHQPLAFLTGSFATRQEHWSTYERDAYAIVRTFRKMSYSLACDPSVHLSRPSFHRPSLLVIRFPSFGSRAIPCTTQGPGSSPLGAFHVDVRVQNRVCSW